MYEISVYWSGLSWPEFYEPYINGVKNYGSWMKNTFKCIADCDMCGLCTVFKGKDPELAYDDYICGRREYMDVSDYNK